MLKKSTLLFLSVFLLLAFSVNPVEAAKPECGNKICEGGEKKKCPADCNGGGGGNGGGDEEGLYSVTTIAGPVDEDDNLLVAVDSISFWEEHKGRESIGLGSFDGGIGLLYLRFLTFEDDIFSGSRGAKCFPDGGPFQLYPEAGISKHRGGSVLGAFWFLGCTDEGTDAFGECITEVLYELDLRGPSLPHNWRPASEDPSTVIIKSWETFFQEGDGRSRSCVGEGDFASDVQIRVTREN